MQEAYLIDLGSLIFEGEDDFDAYSMIYDEKHGYRDDVRFYDLDRERAVLAAQSYVEESGERAYGIVTETWLDDDVSQDDIDNGSIYVEGESYLVEDVVFAKANIDGEERELF